MKQVAHEAMVQHPVEEVWRVWIKNFQVTMPLMAPQLYVSVDYLDGPPLAPGGVFLIKHNPASFPHFDSIKAKWIVMDHDNCYFKAAILEGGHLGEHSTVANLTYSCKLVPGPTPNTCIKKWIFEFDESTQHDFLDYLKEEMSILGSSTCSHIASKA